jgi:preprotein translocase subunit YajC
VLKTELKEGERVRTTTGIVGTVVAADDQDVVTILSGTFMTFDIDRKTICEVLPATDESKKAAWIAKETAQDVREALANLGGGK